MHRDPQLAELFGHRPPSLRPGSQGQRRRGHRNTVAGRPHGDLYARRSRSGKRHHAHIRRRDDLEDPCLLLREEHGIRIHQREHRVARRKRPQGMDLHGRCRCGSADRHRAHAGGGRPGHGRQRQGYAAERPRDGRRGCVDPRRTLNQVADHLLCRGRLQIRLRRAARHPLYRHQRSHVRHHGAQRLGHRTRHQKFGAQSHGSGRRCGLHRCGHDRVRSRFGGRAHGIVQRPPELEGHLDPRRVRSLRQRGDRRGAARCLHQRRQDRPCQRHRPERPYPNQLRRLGRQSVQRDFRRSEQYDHRQAGGSGFEGTRPVSHARRSGRDKEPLAGGQHVRIASHPRSRRHAGRL